MAPSSNVSLLLFGLLLGLGTIFYPHLAPSLSLPFLSPRNAITEASSWLTYQAYQHSIPIVENHNPDADKLPESERRMRMGSKIDKSGFEDSKEDWGRVESAGGENKLGMELPVYYLEAVSSTEELDPESATAIALAKIGNEITSIIRPKTIVLLVPLRSKSSSVLINTSPSAQLLYPQTSSAPYRPSFSTHSSPSLAELLLTYLDVTPALPSLGWSRGLDPIAWSLLVALFGERVEAEVVQVSLPVGWSGVEGEGAGGRGWIEFGRRVREVRDEGVLFIAVGKLAETRVVHPELLDILLAHTSEPREISLLAHVNSVAPKSPPKKPTGATTKFGMDTAGFLVAVGAAGESEAEFLGIGEGVGGGWRFGALPLRRI